MEDFPSRERITAATLEPRVSAIVVVQNAKPGPGRASPLDLCLRGALAEPSVEELIIVDLGNEPEVSSALRAFQADRRDVKLVTNCETAARLLFCQRVHKRHGHALTATNNTG